MNGPGSRMDFVWNLLLYGSALICGVLPWVLVIFAIRNRKAWIWWQRASWKGSLLLALTNIALKIGASYWAFVVKIWLGYGEHDTFQSIYGTLNFLDVGLLKISTILAQQVLTNGHLEEVSTNVGLGVDFLIVFGLFCGLRWSWARFGKSTTNLEPPKSP